VIVNFDIFRKLLKYHKLCFWVIVTLQIAVTNSKTFREPFLGNFDGDDHSFCLIYCTFKCKQ